MALQEGIYRVYNVTLGSDKVFTYKSAMRFQIQGGNLTILEDPSGMLARYVKNGPVEPQTERFINSFIHGSYRHAYIEQPGTVYPPEFRVPA